MKEILFESLGSIDNYSLSSSPQCVYYQRRTQQQQKQQLKAQTLFMNLPSSTTTLGRTTVSVSPSKIHYLYYRPWNTILNIMRNKKPNIWIIFVLCIAVVGIDNYYYQCTSKLLETIGILIPDISFPNTLKQSHQHSIGLGVYSSSNRHVKNTKIPHILIFTHHVNLLTTNLDAIFDEGQNYQTNGGTTTTVARTLTTHNTSNFNNHNVVASIRGFTSRKLKELRILQDNVYRIIDLHSGSGPVFDSSYTQHRYDEGNDKNNLTVRFLTDDDCVQSIRRWAYMRSHRNHTVFVHQKKALNIEYSNPEDIANELISYFHKEPAGMYKADLCRGVALYETGGIYMDVDLGTRMNVFNILLHSTEFATIKVHSQSRYPGAYFQAFIAVTKQHDIIHRYIELFILYYRGTIKIRRGLIGVTLLKRAHDEIQSEQELIMGQNENNKMSISSSSSISPNSKLVLTHVQQTTELWQEVYYKAKYHNDIFADVPIPTWGIYRACKFVVVVPPQQIKSRSQHDYSVSINGSDNIATTSTSTKLIVPMYSRIAGSRMCP
jgi:hypothetical protein